ncbi:hypothetical protein DDW44_28080 [Streptomyces tirandamycinicus]|uniref:Uncharacterized protein n=1 Tax=Streptomyces tirandamycinicus TaxID=2174846 RepID=A0A2S1T0N1_9ACTN|nr:hypothetical protein DDW44_28080 [Streptomyces tirandamycinicus]
MREVQGIDGAHGGERIAGTGLLRRFTDDGKVQFSTVIGDHDIGVRQEVTQLRPRLLLGYPLAKHSVPHAAVTQLLSVTREPEVPPPAGRRSDPFTIGAEPDRCRLVNVPLQVGSGRRRPHDAFDVERDGPQHGRLVQPCSNSGLSAWLAPFGRHLCRAHQFLRSNRQEKAPRSDQQTSADRLGDQPD